MCYNYYLSLFLISGCKDTHYFRITNELRRFLCMIRAKNGAKLRNSSRLFLLCNRRIYTIYYYLTRSPAGLYQRGLSCDCFRPSQGYWQLNFIFITLVLKAAHSPIAGYLIRSGHGITRSARNTQLIYLIIIKSYFTIALTAASPSTETITIPAGAAIVALSEEITELAIVCPKTFVIVTTLPAAPLTMIWPSPAITATEEVEIPSLATGSRSSAFI